jgi:probable F420-dependent oxidoreductase
MLEIWTVLDISLPLSRIGEEARRAEALGFDFVAVPDLIHDGIAAAALASSATERIGIATSALIAFPRSPMTVAVAAWDLQALSKGRFRLGLGPQVRGNIVDRFSTEWTPPAPRMRDYVDAIRAIFDCWQDGKPLDYHGSHYRFTRMQPYTSPQPLAYPRPPIDLAAVGPLMTAMVGEVGDGLSMHPTHASTAYLRERIGAQLALGAERRGRDVDSIRRWVNPLWAIGPDAVAVSERREVHRALHATLLSTPSYWPVLDFHGWREVGQRLHQLVREGRWGDLTALMSDEMLETLVPAATYDELADVALERFAGLADALTLPLPEDPAEDAALARSIEVLRSRW